MPLNSVLVVWDAKRRVQTIQVVSLVREQMQDNPMSVIRKEYLALGFKSAMRLNWLGRILSMQRVSLGRASLFQVPTTVFEETKANLYLLHWMERDPLLTEAFHRPDLLDAVPDFAGYLNYTQDGNGCWDIAIYLDTEFDPTAASAWLAFALFTSVLSGVTTGLSARDWNMALNLGTAILAVFSTLQGILVLMLRGH